MSFQFESRFESKKSIQLQLKTLGSFSINRNWKKGFYTNREPSNIHMNAIRTTIFKPIGFSPLENLTLSNIDLFNIYTRLVPMATPQAF